MELDSFHIQIDTNCIFDITSLKPKFDFISLNTTNKLLHTNKIFLELFLIKVLTNTSNLEAKLYFWFLN